jgi:hypothetical protein
MVIVVEADDRPLPSSLRENVAFQLQARRITFEVVGKPSKPAFITAKAVSVEMLNITLKILS